MTRANATTENIESQNLHNTRVSIVEDDNLVREELVHQLNRAHGFTCVSNHRSAEAAL